MNITPDTLIAWATDLADAAPSSWREEVTARIDALSGLEPSELERHARAALDEFPLFLRRQDAPLPRRVLERLAALAAEREDRPDALLELLLHDWRIEGRSLVPYLDCLLAHGREDAAAAVARYELDREGCRDRDRVQARLDSIGSPPDGWPDAILEFARAPSIEAWDALMQFTPDEDLYHRKRNTLQALMRLGVDGNLLFRCATRGGITPDAIELVERGLVAPQTVVRRGHDGPPTALAQWLGLAARAALAHGDRLGTVRLLREAVANARSAADAELQVMQVRADADDELHDMLDAVGIPR